jgi:hypothetical protein
MVCLDILKRSTHILYKNPILFLLPSIGSAISIISEAIFVIGLRNNNNENYFPFSDILVLVLFFIAFTITYFQLVIARKVIPNLGAFQSKNYDIKVVELLLIYSILAFTIVNIGYYESDARKSFVVKSDRFSLYTFKVNSNHDMLVLVIPTGLLIILLSSFVSIFFSAWMVQYVLAGHQSVNSYGPYEPLKNILAVITKEKEKRKEILLLFLITILISIIGFIFSNIEVIPNPDSSNVYIYQLVILSIIETLYSPFFLIFLFLILSPMTYYET